jgi:threonine/homoserine/homoserine lactone efflux protein
MTETVFEFWSLLCAWYLIFVIWNPWSPEQTAANRTNQPVTNSLRAIIGHLVNCLLAIWPNPSGAGKDQIF